jgi:hypothetical protein
MRKVSKEIAKAFIDGKRKTIGNSHTFTAMQHGGHGYVSLHGNKIAWWENSHPNYNLNNNIHLCFSMCGWDTPTTRERLNTLFSLLFRRDIKVFQKNHEQFLSLNGVDYLIHPSNIYVLRSVNGNIFMDDLVGAKAQLMSMQTAVFIEHGC